MGYGCRELSNQEKRVWVMGQSQAVNNYPLSDTMLLGLPEIRVTLSCFQSTVQTQHAPLTFCDGVFSSAEVGRNNVASKVNKEWTEESKQITRKPGRVGPFSGQPLSEKWKTKALEITRVKKHTSSLSSGPENKYDREERERLKLNKMGMKKICNSF